MAGEEKVEDDATRTGTNVKTFETKSKNILTFYLFDAFVDNLAHKISDQILNSLYCFLGI